MEVDRGEGVHDRVVKKLQKLPLPDVVEVLAEEDVHDGRDEHVDEDEYDERVELARAPVEGEQLEGEEPGDDLEEHVEEHGDPGAGGDGDVEEHVLPDGLVLAVAPGEADHAGDDGHHLGGLHRGEGQADLHLPVLLDGDHVGRLLEDVDDVGEYDVSLDDRLEGRLDVDLDELAPAGGEVALPLPDPGVHPSVPSGRLVYPVPVELRIDRETLSKELEGGIP